MTSIDELFKQSGLPAKRKKGDTVRDPDEIYKSAKLSTNGTGSRHARVEDDGEGDGGDNDDAEAGPSRPPPDEDGDADDSYGPSAPPPDDEDGDDEEGRFFGGGITAQEAQVLDFVDSTEAAVTQAAPDRIDAAWLRKTALAFERRINRNAELRARHEGEPARFIDSEADLDAAVRSLSLLSDHPDLYPDVARLGTAASLVGLLAHENSDIAIAAAGIVGELTDEDVAATEEQWGALVDALLAADLASLLVSTLGRLDEDGPDDADREGVYHVLGVVENLCSRGETALALGRDDGLLDWLMRRAQRREEPVTQNKQYAAEIMAILAQAGPANRTRLAERDAVDVMLQLVAPYRRRDPEKGGEEEEFMADLFEALTCVVDVAAGREKFVAAEGVELCLLMLKEGKMSKLPALRLLDHATGGGTLDGGTEVCVKIVEAGGLKTLFTMFMKRADGPATEHLAGILASMLRLLPPDSPERIRAMAKFVEKDYEKIEKLVTLRRSYAGRLAAVTAEIAEEEKGLTDEEKEDMADDWFSRRLDAGLFVLQTIDVILAWLVAEDDGAKKKISGYLADRDETFEVIAASLREQLDGIEAETEDGKETRDMLSTLIEFLE